MSRANLYLIIIRWGHLPLSPLFNSHLNENDNKWSLLKLKWYQSFWISFSSAFQKDSGKALLCHHSLYFTCGSSILCSDFVATSHKWNQTDTYADLNGTSVLSSSSKLCCLVLICLDRLLQNKKCTNIKMLFK